MIKKTQKLTKQNIFCTVVPDPCYNSFRVVLNFNPRAITYYTTNNEKVAEIECEIINKVIENYGFNLVPGEKKLSDLRNDKGE